MSFLKYVSKIKVLLLAISVLVTIFACRNPVSPNQPGQPPTGPTPPSANAQLSTLVVSSPGVDAHVLSPVFQSNTYNYSLTVNHDVPQVTVSAQAVASGSTLTGTGVKSLNLGQNTLTVLVRNGTASHTYTVVVTRISPLEAPNFHPASGSVVTTATPVTITSTVDGATIRFTQGDGTQAPPTLVTGNIYDPAHRPTITAGNTVIKAMAFSGGAGFTATSPVATATYTISTINLKLASLTLSEGTLSPSFDPYVRSYTATVSSGTGNVTITASAQAGGATVTGTGSQTLIEGTNTFPITVSLSGESQVYTVVITRPGSLASSNANLASLTISAGSLTPAFSPSTLSYSASVSSGVSSLTISATAQQVGANISGDVGNRPLSTGANAFTITVTAPAGNMQSYTLTVTRATAVPPSAASNVGMVAVSGGARVNWNDNSNDETGFTVKRRALGTTSWTQVGTTDVNTTQFIDSNFDRAVTVRHEYRVVAFNTAGSSSPADSASSINLVGFIHPTSGSLSPVARNTWAGANWSLGSHYVSGPGSDVTIAIFSRRATRILLELYGVAPTTGEVGGTAITHARQDYWLERGSDNIWRIRLHNVPVGTYYTFRVWGPNWEWNDAWRRGRSNAGFIADVQNGNRFNPNKAVYDPYTRELSHDKENPFLMARGLNGHIYASGPVSHNFGGSYGTMPRREFDSGPYAPKGIILYTDDLGTITNRPNHPQEDIIVMKTHVRGFTKHESAGELQSILTGFPHFTGIQNIPLHKRGTYAGAALMAPYLAGLGFTAIEFLPIHETANDDNPEGSWSATHPGEVPGNFWGYMTYGFFAPDRRYSSDKSAGGPTREFRQMVNAFHAHGIEVNLDVVYNHTGEGGSWGDSTVDLQNTAEITSFKGIDNVEYYFLSGANRQFFQNYAGTGNAMDFRNPIVQQLTLDSLTYWIDEMGTSGFRYDLAYIMGRTGPNHEFQGIHSPMLLAIQDLGDRTPGGNTAKNWAEAWDATGGYAVGGFPSRSSVGGWATWNDQFRDPLRDWIRASSTGDAFRRAFDGSRSIFWAGPHKSLNLIVAHDGFTLMDLVSYNMNSDAERNAINLGLRYPWGPSDGGKAHNRSWNHGGDQVLRRQQLRNLWTMQMFAKGVPLTVYGDEFNRTQNGNNNPYKIDTIATRNNFRMINTNSPHLRATGTSGAPYHNNYGTDAGPNGQNAFFRFAQFVTRLRRDSQGLRHRDHSRDFTISAPKGGTFNHGDHAFRTSINGNGTADEGIFLVLANATGNAVPFDIWAPGAGFEWRRIIDTGSWAEQYQNFWGPTADWAAGTGDAFRLTTARIDFNVPARTVVVFQRVHANLTAAIVAGWFTSLQAPVFGQANLVLPQVPAGYTIAIHSSSNTSLITTAGALSFPSTATTVNLVLRVTRTSDSTTADTVSIPVRMPSETQTTRLRTHFTTSVGQNIFFGYRVMNGSTHVTSWTQHPGVWAGGSSQGGHAFNWNFDVTHTGPHTHIEWKAFMRQSGHSDHWMPDPDRSAPAGRNHLSAWNNSVNHLE